MSDPMNSQEQSNHPPEPECEGPSPNSDVLSDQNNISGISPEQPEQPLSEPSVFNVAEPSHFASPHVGDDKADQQTLGVNDGVPRHIYRVSPAEPPDWSNYNLSPLEEESPEEDEPSGWKTAWAVVREVGETIILTLIIFFVIQTFIRNFRVVGTSMVGNLHDGQYLIIDKVSYSSFLINTLGIGGPRRGDVIVFEPPNRPDDDYVKRIIGLSGETVEIVNGQVFINGEPLDEPFQPNPGSYTTPPRVVPEGQVFVLGDNRNNSNDSHTWGPLPIENIVGRAWVSYWPPANWGTIPRDAPTSEATLQHVLENLIPHANAESE